MSRIHLTMQKIFALFREMSICIYRTVFHIGCIADVFPWNSFKHALSLKRTTLRAVDSFFP